MCKHVLNAQVAIRSPCCRKWFDCAECHAETADHPLLQAFDMTFACKKCKKCFRKDAQEMEEADEYCPHCDNHFVLDAITPTPRLEVEGEDVRKDARMLKDDRVRGGQVDGKGKVEQQGGAGGYSSIWDVAESADRLG